MHFLNYKNSFKQNKVYFSLLLLTLIFFLLPHYGYAATGSADDPLGAALCRIAGVVMGPTAKAIAMGAIFFVAIGLFSGRMTWLTVVPIILGIIIIFSAPAMVSFITGEGSSACVSSTRAV